MQTSKLFFFGGLLATALTCSLQSCSDDDVAYTTPTLSDDIKARGVTVEINNAVVNIPVNCSGTWTAVLDPHCDWATLNVRETEFTGNKVLQLAIDDNNTGADRKTTLYVADAEGEITEIPVTQTTFYKGEALNNGNGQWFQANGLGYGMNYQYVLDPTYNRDGQSFDPTAMKMKDPIFNIATIESLQNATTPKIRNGYLEVPLEIASLKDEMIDSTLCQNKSLDVTLTLGCSFGFIEFEAHGAYNSSKIDTRANINYNINRNAPAYNVTVSPATIKQYAQVSAQDEAANMDFEKLEKEEAKIEKTIQTFYRRNKKEELTPQQQKVIDGMYERLDRPTYGGVFSEPFASSHFRLEKAILEGDAADNENLTNEKANKILSQIDGDWGPFYISGGDFGGSLNLIALIDTVYLKGEETMNANVSAEIGGFFNLEGELEFSSAGEEIFRNSNIQMAIYGGDANKTQTAISALLQSPEATNRSKMQEILNDWVDSLKGRTDDGIPSKASPIRYFVSPVWTLFIEPEVADYARRWFIEKYTSRGIKIYLGIMENGNDTKVEQIVDDEQRKQLK